MDIFYSTSFFDQFHRHENGFASFDSLVHSEQLWMHHRKKISLNSLWGHLTKLRFQAAGETGGGSSRRTVKVQLGSRLGQQRKRFQNCLEWNNILTAIRKRQSQAKNHRKTKIPLPFPATDLQPSKTALHYHRKGWGHASLFGRTCAYMQNIAATIASTWNNCSSLTIWPHMNAKKLCWLVTIALLATLPGFWCS